MKRRSGSHRNKQSTLLISGIAISGLALGGMATHVFHTAGSNDKASTEETLTEEDHRVLQNYHAEMEKAKQAHLQALEAEDKWYDEVSKTQNVRASMKAEKENVLKQIAKLEVQQTELLRLQKLAKIEKQVASEAVVRSTQAKSEAENHTLNAYETTQQARVKLKQAQTDQEKATALISQFEKLENELQASKQNYAVLDAKHQIALRENNRLTVIANQPKREVVVVNNTIPPVNHIHHKTIIDNSRPSYCPPTSSTTIIRPQTPCPSTRTPKKHKRYK